MESTQKMLKMKLVFNFSVCIILMCINVGATIFIVGSTSLIRKRGYSLVISNILDENNYDCLLNVRIEWSDHKDRSIKLNLMKIVKIEADSSKIVTFEIPYNIPEGYFKIIIEGKQPSNRSNVNIRKQVRHYYYDDYTFNRPACFIQLNKPVITPGEMLKFRVVVVDRDLKPVIPHEITISVNVYDPKRNVIRQWSNVSLQSGIFDNQIAIPTMPVMGTYGVLVTENDVFCEMKPFEVRNYDMHSIDLNIYPTVVPLQNHQALNLTIDVKNSFAKLISGSLTIVSVRTYYGNNIINKTQTWDVNGNRQIYLPLKEKLKRNADSRSVILKATFTEQYTNRTISKVKRIEVYKYKYKVLLHNNRLNYHPGSSFTVSLTVINKNIKPAKNVTLVVEVRGANELYRQNCTSNMKGEITFSMHTNETMDLNSLKVYDGDQEIGAGRIEKVDSAHSFEVDYIKVELLTRVKFNRMFRLLVTCSHNMTILLYYVFSKGNVVDAGLFRPNQMSRYSFQLLMSDKFIPRSEIFVVTNVGKSLIFDYVEISINDFGNPLEIKIEENISEDGVDPGDEIELAIRGRPGAFVALAAYDQRLLQHGLDHDITFADVWDRSYTNFPYVMDNGAILLGFPYVFAMSTDDTIEIPYFFKHGSRGIYPNSPRFGMPDPYRTDFWESWLWQNLTIPSSGRFELVTTVPHSTTSWYITGISIDPKYGLGIVKMPVTFSTHKIFFILDHLPHSIKRNETVSMHFTLFSKIKEEFKATVTMFNVNNQIQFFDNHAGGIH